MAEPIGLAMTSSVPAGSQTYQAATAFMQWVTSQEMSSIARPTTSAMRIASRSLSPTF